MSVGRTSGGQSREVTFLNTFTGGLNLTTQLQSLRPDETPDCLNVDFGLRGGFVTRGGFQAQVTNAKLDGARFLGPTYFTEDVFLIQTSDHLLASWDGALTVSAHSLSDTDVRVRMAVFNRAAYFAGGRLTGNIVMRKWDGTTFSTLGNAWNNDYTAPTTGNMVRGKHIVEHRGFMFVANTEEGDNKFPHRVRFSHEQFPESFAEADFFDVDPTDDGDPVTGLVAFREMLLIFKRSSVWALFGYNRDSWVLEQVTNASGTCTCGAIAVNSGVAYWYSTDGDLMAFDGRGVKSLGQPIRWWSDLGKIQHGGAHRLMWSDERLYLSLQAGASETVGRWLFVWDPTTKTFTRYDRQVTELAHWAKLGEDADPLFLETGSPDLFRYDRKYATDSGFVDSVLTTQRIGSYLRTSWINAGETATRKRWKRPRITAAADADCTIRMRVYRDFDDSTIVRQRSFDIVTGEDSLWGTMDWGDEWSAGFQDFYEFARLGSAGTGYAIQFEFASQNNLGRWWVDSLAVPFRRKAIK